MDEDTRRVTRSQKQLKSNEDQVSKTVTPSKLTNRKTGKAKTPVKSISETRTPTSITKSGRKFTSNIDVISEESEESEEFLAESADTSSDSEITERPTTLFEDGDVAGSQMFGFQTPKRKNAMVNKANESTGKISNSFTPKSGLKGNVSEPKTPYSLRTRIKRKIVKEVTKLQEDVILEDSGSEYSPSESDTESDSGESFSNEEGITPIEQVKAPSKKPQDTSTTPHRRRKEKDSNYVFTSDKYFETHTSKPLTTDHTLNRLETPRLGQDQLVALLKSVNPSHQQSVRALNEENSLHFKKWLFTLREGYSILLYGLGSKRTILNSFHREYLKDQPVLVINGYFPGLTIKEILDSLTDLLRIKNVPTQTHDLIDAVSHHLMKSSTRRIFLIIHNLDGPMLRNDKSQGVLSELAKIPKLHLLASVDHINCPLLWDQSKLSDFNFAWEDATSFLPYTEETSFESSIMVQRSGSLALAALKNVFQSLTTNSRNIFKLLLKYQLENNKKDVGLGMQFSDLYRSCRDAFIVSSDLALRTQLTEFIDHQLVKWKKETDHLIIPIECGVLKQFQSEINDEEE